MDSPPCALILRKTRARGLQGGLELHSVVVQSFHMKALLKKVLKDYPGVTQGLRTVEFERPFTPFLHRWDELSDALAACPDDASIKTHWQLLYEVIHDALSETIAKSRDLIAHGVITMDLVWASFKPGDIVISHELLGTQAMEITSLGYGDADMTYFQVGGRYMDHDGESVGYCDTSVSIRRFHGTRKITDLDVFPLNFLDDWQRMEPELIARGKKFEHGTGICFKSCKGAMTVINVNGPPWCSTTKAESTNQRVIIDPEAFEKATQRSQPLKSRNEGGRAIDCSDTLQTASFYCV